MTDLIDRQEALEGLYDVFFDDELSAAYPNEADKVLDVIRKLPSAQPETHDKRTETHECDLINRQQAIDIVRNRVKRFTTACVLAVTEIEKLPSAQTHWIPCGERLPSEGDTVLLSENYAYSIGRLIKTTTGEYEWSVNGWYTNIDDWSAWMPLPEPYGGESK